MYAKRRLPCVLGVATVLLLSCSSRSKHTGPSLGPGVTNPAGVGSIGGDGAPPTSGSVRPDGSSDAADSALKVSSGGVAEGGVAGTDASAPPDGGSSVATRDAGPPHPTFHVFLLLGQSNMAGYPKAQAADKTKDQRVKVLGYDECAATGRHKDQWDVAVAPLHECWNGALGPGDYFSKTLAGVIHDGDTIGLVPCAISGEKIETFLKVGGTKYDWIIQRAQLAQQKGGVIEGIIFHQGESNCGDPAWPAKVNTLVQDLRADLKLGPVPFLAGELVPDGACARHNTLVDQLPNVISNAYVVSAQGLVLDPADTQWHLHFDHDSQVTLGKRYGQKMIEALGW